MKTINNPSRTQKKKLQRLRSLFHTRNMKLHFKNFFGPEYVKSKYGFQFKKNWLDRTFRFYIDGSYGYFYSDHLIKKEKEFVFLDIGANQGLYTICAASNKHCKKAYAFEPAERTFAYLLDNVQANGFLPKCLLFKKAIGAKTGEGELVFVPGNSGLSNMNTSFSNENYFIREKIDVIGADSLFDIMRSNCYQDIVCKIDVEGYEEVVLNSLNRCRLFPNISEILFEINENWTNKDEIIKNLKDEGFSKFKKFGFDAEHYDILALR